MPDTIKKILNYSIEDLESVSKEIISFAEDYKIWIFVGELGAGKTTLIKKICELLGIKDNVNSPTYSLVNEYIDVYGQSFYHFDFYRLKNETEAMDIGVEEYFYSGSLCFIEWPEKIISLIPENHIKIFISLVEDNLRSIFLSKHDQ